MVLGMCQPDEKHANRKPECSANAQRMVHTLIISVRPWDAEAKANQILLNSKQFFWFFGNSEGKQ